MENQLKEVATLENIKTLAKDKSRWNEIVKLVTECR